jgi:hypothetical protein
MNEPEKKKKKKKPLKSGDLTNEKSRSYTIHLIDESHFHEIFIDHPVTVFYAPGHAFHRVFDGAKTILCPAPGVIKDPVSLEFIGYCEVSWEPKDKKNPCGW